MKKIFTLFVVLCLSYLTMGASTPKHEFRATWLATVSGIDWPKTKATNDATREQQKQELIDILDKMKAGNLNAVCFQVRSLCDAMYQSSYEPWSIALTGTRGKDPGYDPLQFAIDEAHKRGMELHVWVNPFRASTSTLAATDMLWDNAGDWLIKYNNSSFSGYLIDPGYPESRAYVVKVLMEIINNYDVDGLVMDDYFYAYGGTTNQDSVAQALHYRASEVIDVNNNGNKIDDWRRSNVDNVIKAMYDSIQVVKPWVRFGMGPGGIWSIDKNAAEAYGLTLPSGIRGSDPYTELYCNTVEWIKQGWVDYVNPQIYWSTQVAAQDYDVLCQWWSKDVCEHFSNLLPNGKKVHHFPSPAAYKVYGDYSGYEDGVEEMKREMDANRANLSSGYTGAVFYNTTSYLKMYADLAASHFKHTALTPPMDWKSNTALAAPTNLTVSGSTLTWQHPTAERFTVYVYPKGTAWSTAKNDPAYLQGVIYGKSMDISGIDTNMNDIAVCAYDRFGVEHEVAIYSDESGTVTPPASGTITYVLNGGMMNEFGWTSKNDMFQACMADCSVTDLATLDEVKASADPFYAICSKLTDVSGMLNSDKWDWLEQYIMDVQNTQAGTLVGAGSVPVLTAGVTSAAWRYALAAFFIEGQRTTWPYSADFSQAGKDEAYIPAWKHVYTNPTSVTTEFTLYDPCREGYTFLGWYTNADFSGDKVTTINSETTGTLYAKWIDETWVIKYTSTDGNIVTPYATNVFGANIVSNTYENGVGSITFDGPVTSIGEEAFYHCTSLASITIPNSVISIGVAAFSNCGSLNFMVIPEGVTTIGSNAFQQCFSLQSIYIPRSVTSIGDAIFIIASMLGTIVVDDSNMVYDSRSNCNAIIETATNTLIAGCQNTVIPNSVATIGNEAFAHCYDLTSITIPNSVTSIGDRAFYVCSSLTSITIPNSVTSIGDYAFSSCSGLTSIVVEGGNATYDSRENCNAIIETATNTLIAGCKNTIIPNSVTSIGADAFYSCKGLTSITIPNSVTSIGEYAFSGCSSLTSITIPNSVTSIGDDAFWGCSSLTSITIPNSVTSIGEGAFVHCEGLTSITIPNSVTSIGSSAFSGCSSLTSITIPNSVTSIGRRAFLSCSSLDTIHVEATTPPALEDSTVFMNTPSPICVIPCGTLAVYEASDWANYMGEFVEVCPTVVKAKVPAAWENDDITVWVWTDGAGTEYPTTKEGDWYVYTHTDDTEFNIIFKSGIGWKGNTYQTVDINGITENTCLEIQPTNTKATYTIVDCPSIIYELNGGVTNDYDWMSKDDMYHELLVDINAIMPTTKVDVDTVTLAYDKTKNIQEGIPTYWGSLDSLFTNFDFLSKWSWLINYMDSTCVLESKSLPSTSSAYLRYNLSAFFSEKEYTSWPQTPDYSKYGLYPYYQPAWQHAYDNPTNPTEEFVLNAPYKEGYTFAGWYTTPDFSGEKVTTINAETEGTLYAKWIDETWVIKYTSTDGNIITPYATDVFGANIVSNIYENGVGTITFDGPVTSIGRNAFKSNSRLKFITIPNSTTAIGNSAFNHCSNLSAITIPNSVTSIGNNAFNGCSGLTSILVEKGNTVYDSRNNCNAIIETATNTLIVGCKNTIITNSVTIIGDYVFHHCSGLTSITIPNSVTSIGVWAFSNCSSLNIIHVRASVPPILEDSTTFAATPSPTCYIPCGTLAAYEASDWAQYVSEFIEEGCISFELNGGVVSAELPIYIASSYTLPTPTREGYIFRGWYDNPQGIGNSLSTLPAGYEGTIYAYWTKEPTDALNPFAYALSSELSQDNSQLLINYSLNARAMDVQIVIMDGETAVKTIACDGLSKGSHSIAIPTAGLPEHKQLTWKVEVKGAEVTEPTEYAVNYSFYHPSAVDIDNNPENPTFGMILTNEGMHKVKDIEGYLSTGYGAGIYAFNPAFEPMPNGDKPGYNGGIEFTNSRADNADANAYSPYRIRISEDGRIFVTSLNTDGNYLWEVNPENMNEWNSIFKGTLNGDKELVDAGGNFIAAPNTGFDVKGSGENLQLMMYSVNLPGITAAMSGFRCDEYNLGTATTWATAPSKAWVEGLYAINYTGIQVEYDNEGGIWIAFYRGAASDANPGLVHINKDGVEDLKLLWSNLRRAGIRFNNDFTKLIIAGVNGGSATNPNKKATIYSISKDANGAPILTEEWLIDMATLGNYLNDFAWDYAGNLYGVSNSSEKIVAWAMPRSADDIVTTPAASKYSFIYSDDAITYELNGGVTNDYGWQSKADMWSAFCADAGISVGTLDEVKAAGEGSWSTICTPLGASQAQAILDNAKWDWLEAYIMNHQNADAAATKLTEGTSSAGWRYALAAFFIESQRTSWPISADFSQAGKDEAYIPTWRYAFANPTNPTEEFVLNAPYKEGYTFAGWYTTPDFSGEKVTTINTETIGTLYAKWVDYIPTIKQVRALADNTKTKVAGVVNHIDGRNIYIQDVTGGILLYTNDTPTCKVGDKIVAEGVRFTYAGAPEVKNAVIESAETATLYDVTTFETLTPLISDSIDHKYFATRVTIPGLKIVFYDSYNNPTVEDVIGNQSLCYNMPLDPVAFPIGKRVTITAVGGWYNGFQFVGDASAIDLSAYPKKDTYDYPVRAERYTLTNDWVYSNIEGNFAANKPGSNNFVRGMAAKDGIMYFINRENGSLTRVDGATGEMLEPLKITGEHLFERIGENGEWESACTLPFNDIKFDQAGNCLIGACVSATASTQPFMIYLVDLTTGECTELINDDLRDNPGLGEVTFRFDAFGAAGDVTKNGVVMAADANDGWNVYRWLITDGEVAPAEQITILLDPEYDQSLFINAYGWGTAPQIFPQDEVGSLFYVDGWNMLPMLFDEGGMLVDDFINCPTQVEVTNNDGDVLKMNTAHNGLVEFQVGDEYFLLMAASNTAVTAAPSTFALYKFANEGRTFDGLEPLWYFPANGMGTLTNGCRTAVPSVEVVDDNTANLYLYTNNNGYARYTLNVGDNIADPIDPTWQITYTSSNDSIVTPYATDVFGANIVSNTYENGVGTITFDGPVTSIGDYAFHHSRSLTSITIPNSVTSIGVDAFYDCSLISITIPNSVTSIGNSAFHGCSSLTSITIPNSVTSIGNNAFYHCSSLTSITIPNSVTSIGERAFRGCSSIVSMSVKSSNTTYDSREDCNAIIETATNTLIAGCQNTIIPNSVTSIGEWAFGECSFLTSITIPNSVTSVGERAFQGCSSLTSITIPNSVISIGDNPFGFTDSLTTIIVETGNIYYDSRENCNAIILTSTNTLISGCQNTIIPSGVTSIGYIAFMGCSSLISITIPNSVTSIGGAAFSSCSGLTSITIPSNVESVGDFAFGWDTLDTLHIEATTPPTLGSHKSNSSLLCYIPCGTLAAYEASDWAQYVSEFVEEGCPKITYELNGGVTNDYGWQSKGAVALELQNDYNAAYGTSKEWAKAENGYIYYKLGEEWVREDLVPAGTDCITAGFIAYVTYNNSDNLKNLFAANPDKYGWLNDIIIATRTAAGLSVDDASMAEIIYRYELSAFFLCSPERTSWPGTSSYEVAGTFESFKTIWKQAFANPTNPAEEFVLNAPYKEGYTFAGWYTNADFSGERVTTINAETNGTLYAKWINNDWIITYTSTDGNIVTPYKTDVFGANIVSNTYENGVGTITFDGPVTSIGYQAFRWCESLTSITIPNSVTSIGYNTFDACSFTSITIPECVNSIGASAFEDCRSLASITIPNSVTSIGAGAFMNCYSLSSITIPNGVSSIERYVFANCESLSFVIIPNSVTTIGDYAFDGCTSLISVTIPQTVTNVGKCAFRHCKSITSITIPNSVTEIGTLAFGACDSLKSMIVESGNAIYDSRENCNAIIETKTNTLIAGCQNTIIPNSVENIGPSAFWTCISLASITIPNGVMCIGEHAFRYCFSLASITLPETVTSIGESAFEGCRSLTSITIPNSLTSIGQGAFKNCSVLDTIHLEATTPPALEDSTVFMNTPSPICVIPCGTLAAYEASDWASQVGEFVEEGCAPIQMCGDDLYWEYADGVLTITGTGDMYDYAVENDVPWYGVRGNIKTINMPDEMTKIGDYAFYKCTALTSVTLPEQLKHIGNRAFAQDTKIAGNIVIPEGVNYIEERAFFNLTGVSQFQVLATTPPTLEDKLVFDYVKAPIVIPCGYGLVYRKANIWKDLNLSTCEVLIDNLYYMPVGDNEAHIIGYDNKPAGTLTIPGSVVIGSKTRTVTTLADSLFFDCKEISSVIFNEGLESIGERAFVRCGLTGTIVLPSTLSTIGERAFSYCDNVEKYILQAMTPPALANDVFTGSNSKALFYVSCEAMDDYKVAARWSSLKSRLRDACLNIYHYNTALGANGVHTTEDTLVASIYYRRKFTTSRWETLYLPFEVDRVTVLEDGVEYDLKAWSIFSGGHYYLAKPYGIENKEVVFGFTQVVDAHTPYIIQFKEPYFHDKMITFHGKESWNKLNTSFEALPISFEMQMAGNTTLQDQILEEPVYMLRASSNFLLQNITTTLHPFECYVMPYATPSGTPARMNVRFRGDVPTAVESVKGNESHLTYTVDGYTLTVYPQGQAFSIYSLNGALIYSCEAGKEAVDCELNSGCYLLHAGTEAHKIML